MKNMKTFAAAVMTAVMMMTTPIAVQAAESQPKTAEVKETKRVLRHTYQVQLTEEAKEGASAVADKAVETVKEIVRQIPVANR